MTWKDFGGRCRAGVLRITIVLLISCEHAGASRSQLLAEGNRVGHLRGYKAVNQVVASRLIHAPGFDIGWLLDGHAAPAGELAGFRLLLGGFNDTPSHREFINGTPNAVNALLWDKVLSRLAAELGKVCVTGTALNLTIRSLSDAVIDVALEPTFAAAAWPLCQTSVDDVARRAAMLELWFAVMGYEPPESEFASWYAAFRTDEANLAPSERLRRLLRSMLMNPYFLLET